MANAVQDASFVNPELDQDDSLAKSDPEYGDEAGISGSAPATGGDLTEKPVDEDEVDVGRLDEGQETDDLTKLNSLD